MADRISYLVNALIHIMTTVRKVLCLFLLDRLIVVSKLLQRKGNRYGKLFCLVFYQSYH